MRYCRSLFFISLILSALSACHSTKQVKGNGHEVTKVRPLSAFHQVKINGNYRVEITQGTQSSVQLTTDENIEPLITTEVQQGILSIGNQAKTVFLLTKPIRIKITTKSIDHVVCAAKSALSLKNLNVAALSIATKFDGVKGSDLSTTTDVAHVKNDPDSDVLLNLMMRGVVNTLSLNLTGTARVIASDLQVKSAKVSLKGSGFFTMNVSNRLEVNTIGAIHLKYRGNPPALNFFIIGSGKLEGPTRSSTN